MSISIDALEILLGECGVSPSTASKVIEMAKTAHDFKKACLELKKEPKKKTILRPTIKKEIDRWKIPSGEICWAPNVKDLVAQQSQLEHKKESTTARGSGYIIKDRENRIYMVQDSASGKWRFPRELYDDQNEDYRFPTDDLYPFRVAEGDLDDFIEVNRKRFYVGTAEVVPISEPTDPSISAIALIDIDNIAKLRMEYASYRAYSLAKKRGQWNTHMTITVDDEESSTPPETEADSE